MPASFTYLQGQAARDHWAAARKAYLGTPATLSPDAVVSDVLDINASNGAIRVSTPEAYVAVVRVGAANGARSDTASLTLTVA